MAGKLGCKSFSKMAAKLGYHIVSPVAEKYVRLSNHRSRNMLIETEQFQGEAIYTCRD